MNKPEAIWTSTGGIFPWPEYHIRAELQQVSQECVGNLVVKYEADGDSRVLLPITTVNLLSLATRSQIIKKLANHLEIDWDAALSFIVQMTAEKVAAGEPAAAIGMKPDTMKLDYQLYPILEKGQPTTIYGPGSSAKSYLAEYIAVLVQAGIASPFWIPTQGNVLYLDWETCQGDHQRRAWAIKKGLLQEGCAIDMDVCYQYRFCSQPVVTDIYAIQKMVSDGKVSLVIIDSQMAATGYGPDPAQAATIYYNALRSLHCTTLTLDHVNKEDWRAQASESVGPYGSVVKYNRSRSQFEIQKSQNPGDKFLELSLIHRKHNEGKLLKPIGVRINFNEDNQGVLESTTFQRCDIADNPAFAKNLGHKDRMVALLKHGPLRVKDIADALGISGAVVSARFHDNKDIFIHLDDGTWGLVASELL